jgi:LmbE family N-acetylglucosaminyl deacetylase
MFLHTLVGKLSLAAGSTLVLVSVAVLCSSVTSAAETPRALASLLSARTRLMVFAPHPDDETLGAGGLIQRTLGSGGAVHVVFLTSGDGYPEGVELEEHIAHPTAQDYRAYGSVRQNEARRVLAVLGVKEQEMTFLGFPDRGLCPLLQQYWSDQGSHYVSPFTQESRPPPAEVILPGTDYSGEDLNREILRVLTLFRPTLIALPHPADQHPDHCATYFFVQAALHEPGLHTSAPRLQVFTFLIHFGQWPIASGAGTGAQLHPPSDFPEPERTWLSLPFSAQETETKRTALLHYQSQMLTMGRYLLSFARANELFLLDPQRTTEADEKARCCGR